MTAFLIATIKGVKDRAGLEQYWAKVGPSFEGSGAKPLAVYTPFRLVEGDGPIEGMVLFAFPDMAAATAWYESPAYQAARQYRLGAADIELVLLEGGIVTSPDERMPWIKGNSESS